jgi:thiamine transport system permease protein
LRWSGRLGYLLSLLFLTLPILVLLPLAWHADWAFLQQTQLTQVIMRSLVLAVAAALLSLCLALALLSLWRAGRRERFRQWVAGVALYPLVVPAMVVSVGLYILLMPWVDWQAYGWIAVILMNAVIALPFVFQQLRPAVSDYDASYARLLADLNPTRFTHWRYIYLPYLKPLLRRVLAISFVLALGDMSVFAIFGSDDWRTLPWLIYTLAGGYRLAEAALVSVLLLALALAALRFLEKSYD